MKINKILALALGLITLSGAIQATDKPIDTEMADKLNQVKVLTKMSIDDSQKWNNLLRILNEPSTSTYKQLVLKYHPDKHPTASNLEHEFYTEVTKMLTGLKPTDTNSKVADESTKVADESTKKASFIKPNATKLVTAATASINQLSAIVTSVVEIAKLKDNEKVAAAIRGMLPVNLKKAQQAGQKKGTVVAKAFKDFATVAPQVIRPAVHIVNSIIIIIKSFGEALINPAATVRGKKALDTFNSGITTISAIMGAAESALTLLPGLPMPTDEQAEKAEAALEKLSDF